MATKIQLRRDTATNWNTANPVLMEGELGIETDSNKAKIGDGTSAWKVLQYVPNLQKVEYADIDNLYNPLTDCGIYLVLLNEITCGILEVTATWGLNGVHQKLTGGFVLGGQYDGQDINSDAETPTMTASEQKVFVRSRALNSSVPSGEWSAWEELEDSASKALRQHGAVTELMEFRADGTEQMELVYNRLLDEDLGYSEENTITLTGASETSPGVMSAADKKKLDNTPGTFYFGDLINSGMQAGNAVDWSYFGNNITSYIMFRLALMVNSAFYARIKTPNASDGYTSTVPVTVCYSEGNSISVSIIYSDGGLRLYNLVIGSDGNVVEAHDENISQLLKQQPFVIDLSVIGGLQFGESTGSVSREYANDLNDAINSQRPIVGKYIDRLINLNATSNGSVILLTSFDSSNSATLPMRCSSYTFRIYMNTAAYERYGVSASIGS